MKTSPTTIVTTTTTTNSNSAATTTTTITSTSSVYDDMTHTVKESQAENIDHSNRDHSSNNENHRPYCLHNNNNHHAHFLGARNERRRVRNLSRKLKRSEELKTTITLLERVNRRLQNTLEDSEARNTDLQEQLKLSQNINNFYYSALLQQLQNSCFQMHFQQSSNLLLNNSSCKPNTTVVQPTFVSDVVIKTEGSATR